MALACHFFCRVLSCVITSHTILIHLLSQGLCVDDLFPGIFQLHHDNFSLGHVKCSPLRVHQQSYFAYRDLLIYSTCCKFSFNSLWFSIKNKGVLQTFNADKQESINSIAQPFFPHSSSSRLFNISVRF